MVEEFLNPQEIIRRLKLEKNMSAADFGCGAGGWAIPLAKELEDGKVYAIDLLEEPLSFLRGKLRAANILNVEIVKSDVERTIYRLLSGAVDCVLMTNLLFQLKDRQFVFKEASRICRPAGKVLVVDWNETSAAGPETRVSAEQVKTMAKVSGFSLIDEFPAGAYHYGLVFQKNDA